MNGVQRGRRALQLGRAIIVVIGIVFMIVAVVVALNPLMGEEEELPLGLTFEDLQRTNPPLADTIWHNNIGISALAFGNSLLVIILAWRGLARGSRLAWYSILILSLTFVVGVLIAHLPIYVRYPSYVHWRLPLTLTVVQLVGLALTAKPVFAVKQEG